MTTKFRFAVVCTELSFQDDTIERHGGKYVPGLNQKAFLCEFACSPVFPTAALVSLTTQKTCSIGNLDKINCL